MKCINCGAKFLNNARFCIKCGMSQPQTEQNILQFPQYYDQTTSKMKKIWIKVLTVVCFEQLASCVVAYFGGNIVMALVVAVLFFSEAILIGFKKIWISALSITLYLLYSIALLFVVTWALGSDGAWFVGRYIGQIIINIIILICAVGATIILLKTEKAYNTYIRRAMQNQEIGGENITVSPDLNIHNILKKRKIEKLSLRLSWLLWLCY